MGAILRVRDENGNFVDIPAIVGPRGEQGPVGPQGSQGIQGIQGEKGADGKTPYIGDNGNWWIDDVDTGKPSVGEGGGSGGQSGADGVSITDAEINEAGELVLSFSQGDPKNVGKVVGEDGKDGKDGTNGKDGVNGTNGENGTSATHSWNGTVLTIASASGTSSADLKGEKGDTGENGANGQDGRTPVKGTDYFTEEDKAEFLQSVISALPIYDGEVVDE